MYFGGTLVHSKYLYIAFLGSNLTITPMNSTQPSPLLTVRSSLTCEIEADFPLSDTAIESRWIIPNGATIRINADNVKYSVIQGPTGDGGYLTILVIQPTIYSDENTYTCEVRDIRDPDNRGPWLPSQATLRLLGKHLNMECHSIHNCHEIHSGIDC